tara:strand:+ start:232 stop:513 length:282 start_codon:yes stop_codon:yes gene_type:complete
MIWALVTLSFLLIVFIFYCIKFALIILKVKDAIEESLEKIDESYYKISEVLNIPIFYNSKEVKIVIDEIKNSRDILLFIARNLTNSIEEEKDE